jgi:hypothetical protein
LKSASPTSRNLGVFHIDSKIEAFFFAGPKDQQGLLYLDIVNVHQKAIHEKDYI